MNKKLIRFEYKGITNKTMTEVSGSATEETMWRAMKIIDQRHGVERNKGWYHLQIWAAGAPADLLVNMGSKIPNSESSIIDDEILPPFMQAEMKEDAEQWVKENTLPPKSNVVPFTGLQQQPKPTVRIMGDGTRLVIEQPAAKPATVTPTTSRPAVATVTPPPPPMVVPTINGANFVTPSLFYKLKEG